MKEMIAYCGLSCSACPAFVATKKGDREALTKLAEDWSREFKTTLKADDCLCDGCTSTTGRHIGYCRGVQGPRLRHRAGRRELRALRRLRLREAHGVPRERPAGQGEPGEDPRHALAAARPPGSSLGARSDQTAHPRSAPAVASVREKAQP